MQLSKDKYMMKNILTFMLTVVVALISIIIGINDGAKLAFLFSLIGFLIMFLGILSILKNFASLTMAYLAFMFLYTYAGVASVLWGSGLHPVFNSIYQPTKFIIYSNIAYSMFFLGFILCYNMVISSHEISDGYKQIFKAKSLINRAIICTTLALFMEFINFIRVGGLSAVIQGKAFYASMISELTFTLPSEMFLIVSGIYFSLYISNHVYKDFKIIKKKMLIYIIPTTVLFLLYIVLGMRGVMLSYIMILLVGSLYKKTKNKISVKLIIIVLIIYFMLAIVYTSRASIGYYLIENKDIRGFVDVVFKKEMIIDALLPTEFTVAFGNFNQYITSSNHILKLGSTYLIGFLILIPSFLYPGTKPLQIVYEFRNNFFPNEVARGSIAGTGFSILLEAYMNFGVLGIMLNYFIIGCLLAKLEKTRAIKKDNLFISAIYLSCFYFIAQFQRSSFADVLSSVFMLLIVIFITSNNFMKTKSIHK